MIEKILKKILPEGLKRYLIRRYIIAKYEVILGKNVKLNKNVFFEGKNAVFNNSEFTNSYMGLGSYIANNSVIRSTKIGRFCAIGDNVRTCLGRHPTNDFVSIHPVFFSTQKQGGFTFVNKKMFEEHKYVDEKKKYVCEIGNDVWIGNNVLIMDGITIEDGVIIAAGSIVTKDVEPYSIVGGIPSRIIRYRFNEEQIKLLLKFKWWEKDLQWLKDNACKFTDINTFIKFLRMLNI